MRIRHLDPFLGGASPSVMEYIFRYGQFLYAYGLCAKCILGDLLSIYDCRIDNYRNTSVGAGIKSGATLVAEVQACRVALLIQQT